MTGTPKARQASERPRTASWKVQNTSGFSGEPKLRQSVMAAGSPPAHDDVAGGLGERDLRAHVRVEVAVAAVAVARDRDAAALVADAEHGGIAAREHHGVEDDLVVVLLPDPAARADVGAGQQAEKDLAETRGLGGQLELGHRVERLHLVEVGRAHHGGVVDGGVVRERGRRACRRPRSRPGGRRSGPCR